MSVKVVGQVKPMYAVKGKFPNGKIVTFHTAYLRRDEQVTFYVPEGEWPSTVAMKLGLKYYFMRNATLDEAAELVWVRGLDMIISDDEVKN